MSIINTIEKRDKVFQRIKQHMDKVHFDGAVNADRTSFLKIINNMQDGFDAQSENDPNKSGNWNFIDIVKPTNDIWKAIPYLTRPDEADDVDYKTYLRIESLSTIARLIIILSFTDSARDIFDDGCNDQCPPHHKYIKVQYGMKALYEKYYTKSLSFGIAIWEQKMLMVFRPDHRSDAAIQNVGPN